MNYSQIGIIVLWLSTIAGISMIITMLKLKKIILIGYAVKKIIEVINEDKTEWLFNDGQLFRTNDFLESFSNTNILKMMFYRKIFTGNKNFSFGFLLDRNIEFFESTLCEIVSEIERKEKVIRNFQQQRNKFK